MDYFLLLMLMPALITGSEYYFHALYSIYKIYAINYFYNVLYIEINLLYQRYAMWDSTLN